MIDEMDEKVEGSNYKNPTVFEEKTEIHPDYFYQREQIKPLIVRIIEFLRFKIAHQAIVMGPRGTGKTSVTKYLLQEINKKDKYDVNFVYYNCNGILDSYNVMKGILGTKKNLSRDRVLEDFKEWAKGLKCQTVIILDELDKIKDDTVLYYLTRDSAFIKVMTIMITKTPRFYNSLSADVKSSMNEETIIFDSYNTDEMVGILTKRAEAGLHKFDKTVLMNIAVATIYKANGDVRVGMKVMNHFFKNEDFPRSEETDKGPRVSKELKEEINNVAEKEYENLKKHYLMNLSELKKLVLYFCSIHKTSGHAYTALNEKAFSTISRPHFLKIVDELVHMDLISAVKGRQGKVPAYFFDNVLGVDNLELLKVQVHELNLIATR